MRLRGIVDGIGPVQKLVEGVAEEVVAAVGEAAVPVVWKQVVMLAEQASVVGEAAAEEVVAEQAFVLEAAVLAVWMQVGTLAEQASVVEVAVAEPVFVVEVAAPAV